MKQMARIPLVVALAATIVGCVPYKNTRVLEAEERVVIYSERTKGTEKIKVMCPEPSPDALKTLAASAEVEKQEVAKLAATYAEAAANIGLRTHTIQLLRDQLFTICQAYANEGITPTAYQMMLTRNQRNTVALMTVEQLTGVLRGPSATLSGSAALGPNQELKNLYEKLKKEKEAEYNKLQEADKAKPAGMELKKQIDEYGKLIEKAEKAMASAVASGESQPDSGQRLDPASVEKVTSVIETLTMKALNHDDSFYICLDVYQSFGATNMPNKLKERCDDVFQESEVLLVPAAQK